MSVHRLTYDPEAQAAYVTLSDALIVTTREIAPGVLLDLDADANVVGVELLNVEMEGAPQAVARGTEGG